jgi:hypothetical protein
MIGSNRSKNWIKDAQTLDEIASDSDLFAKKVKAKEIFGSNLLLGEKISARKRAKNSEFPRKIRANAVGRTSCVPPYGFGEAD